MIIVFDFEITETPIADTPKIRLILSETYEFVYQRLRLLGKEMDLYTGAVAINIMGTLGERFIVARGDYPQSLLQRMQESISDSDVSYLQEKVLRALEEIP